MNIGWTPEQEKELKRIIFKYFPHIKILVFGSRSNGKFRPTSDLDLCLRGKSPLDLSQWSKCEEEISSTDIPFKIDLSDWHRMSAEFQEIVTEKGREF